MAEAQRVPVQAPFMAAPQQVQQQPPQVIELIYGRRSVVLSKPASIDDAKKQAQLCFGRLIDVVDVDQIQLSFRPSYLSAVIWDDAAWAILPAGARVRVVVVDRNALPARAASRTSVPATATATITATGTPAPAAAQAFAAPNVNPVRHAAPRSRAARTSAATARQERRARQDPYRAPSQADIRQINRIVRSFERSFNAVRATERRDTATGAPQVQPQTHFAHANPTRPPTATSTHISAQQRRLNWEEEEYIDEDQTEAQDNDEEDELRSSAPSPPSVRDDPISRSRTTTAATISRSEGRNHRLLNSTAAERILARYNDHHGTTYGATRTSFSSSARAHPRGSLSNARHHDGSSQPVDKTEEEENIAAVARAIAKAVVKREDDDDDMATDEPATNRSVSSCADGASRASPSQRAPTEPPRRDTSVVTPPADAIALYLPCALAPVTMVRLRDGASYLRPVPQDISTVDDLEPDFRFRQVRERIARMRGWIPDRTSLIFRNITLEDYMKASEVNMKQGDTIFYFFVPPRISIRPNNLD